MNSMNNGSGGSPLYDIGKELFRELPARCKIGFSSASLATFAAALPEDPNRNGKISCFLQ
jgi:hypothetical protein